LQERAGTDSLKSPQTGLPLCIRGRAGQLIILLLGTCKPVEPSLDLGGNAGVNRTYLSTLRLVKMPLALDAEVRINNIDVAFRNGAYRTLRQTYSARYTVLGYFKRQAESPPSVFYYFSEPGQDFAARAEPNCRFVRRRGYCPPQGLTPTGAFSGLKAPELSKRKNVKATPAVYCIQYTISGEDKIQDFFSRHTRRAA